MSAASSLRIAAAAFLFSTLLAACGGGDGDDAELRAERQTPGSASTLLDDEGLSMPSDPRAIPSDSAARTRAGRYATRSQSDDLQRALGHDLSVVEVGCCGSAAIDEAVVRALAARPSASPPAAVLIRGTDLRLAAVVADRLDARGLDRVWLVSL